MGLDHFVLDFISECTKDTIGNLYKKQMLELGSQEILEKDRAIILEKTGKQYFENRGVLHTSFDLDGAHGSLKVNLAKPIKNPEWLGYFDIVTNSGTSEHVEPYRAQYECFKNIHDCLKKGGIAVHIVPDIKDLKNHGYWERHCNNYYSTDFFEMLAKNNNYKLISLKQMTGMIWISLMKQEDSPFMEDREEFLSYIIRKKSGIKYPGINSWGISQVCYFVKKLIKPLYYRMKPKDRPLLMKVKPLWLREKIFCKFYKKKEGDFTKLFEETPLEFNKFIRLNLVPSDEYHKYIAFTGFFELGLTKRIIQLARTEKLFVDIGANCGYYSCLWAGSNPNNKVLAFEPSPKIAKVLRSNVKINKLNSQIQILEIATGKNNTKMPFGLGPNGQTNWGSFLNKPEKDSIEIDVVRLDDIVHKFGFDHIDVLKIDAEGADTWALLGAEGLLRNHKIRHIFYEKNIIEMKRLGINPREAQEFLISCGYKVKPIVCGYTFKPIDTSSDLGEYYAYTNFE